MKNNRLTILLFASMIVACGDSGDGGGGGAATGSSTSGAGGALPATCPGFESTPGAGCPAPCEPLVQGGPGGRAYCTTHCEDSLECPAKHGCSYDSATPAASDKADTCLPGTCDPAVLTSCPDDFACDSMGNDFYCYPSPGTIGTRCEPFEAASAADCTERCPTPQPVPNGVLCTVQCEPEGGNLYCAAGDGCDPDFGGIQPFGAVCSPGCSQNSDCPGGVQCVQHFCVLF